MDTGTKKKQAAGLTVKGIAALAPGEWIADPAARGAGRLQARKLSSGDLAFYYRYTGSSGDRVRLALGTGLTLAEARERAARLSLRYQSGDRDLRAALENEQRELERQQAAKESAAAARENDTLGALLVAYCAQLEKAGKVSVAAVRGCIVKHVQTAHPALWRKPAVDIEAEDGVTILSSLVDAEKKREAGKLRAYLRAAFAAAVRARLDASSSAALRVLNVRHNPMADLPTLDGGTAGTRDRALTVDELRAYWRRIDAMQGPDGSLLRFHLLTGCQRAEQLARAVVADYDADAAVLILRDIKGRRTDARLHAVPLIPAALEAMQSLWGPFGPHVVTMDRGDSGAGYFVFQHRVRSVAIDMVEAGEASAMFTPGDLRRTVETRLAGWGVTREVRAQLQSHGLGGVQAKHYDRHDYLAEKRAALELLYTNLTAQPATVTPIRKRGRCDG